MDTTVLLFNAVKQESIAGWELPEVKLRLKKVTELPMSKVLNHVSVKFETLFPSHKNQTNI